MTRSTRGENRVAVVGIVSVFDKGKSVACFELRHDRKQFSRIGCLLDIGIVGVLSGCAAEICGIFNGDQIGSIAINCSTGAMGVPSAEALSVAFAAVKLLPIGNNIAIVKITDKTFFILITSIYRENETDVLGGSGVAGYFGNAAITADCSKAVRRTGIDDDHFILMKNFSLVIDADLDRAVCNINKLEVLMPVKLKQRFIGISDLVLKINGQIGIGKDVTFEKQTSSLLLGIMISLDH